MDEFEKIEQGIADIKAKKAELLNILNDKMQEQKRAVEQVYDDIQAEMIRENGTISDEDIKSNENSRKNVLERIDSLKDEGLNEDPEYIQLTKKYRALMCMNSSFECQKELITAKKDVLAVEDELSSLSDKLSKINQKLDEIQGEEKARKDEIIAKKDELEKIKSDTDDKTQNYLTKKMQDFGKKEKCYVPKNEKVKERIVRSLQEKGYILDSDLREFEVTNTRDFEIDTTYEKVDSKVLEIEKKYLEQISNLDQKLNEFKNEKSPYVEKLKAARKILEGKIAEKEKELTSKSSNVDKIEQKKKEYDEKAKTYEKEAQKICSEQGAR